MAHYARVKSGIVQAVIVADESFITSLETEPDEAWVQTSYNTQGGVHYEPNSRTPSADQSKALRKNYATIGHTYDPVRDAFIHLKPYDSWTLNEDTCYWEPPIPAPNDGQMYVWDEATINWSLVATEGQP